MRGRWQATLLAVVLLACLGLAQTQQGHAVLRDLGLYETPATYTELTFSAPGSLPGKLAKPSTGVTVAFGIHNVSGAARSYQWSILVVRAGKSQVKSTGTVLTPAQGRTAVSRSVVTMCTAGQVQVVVQLASPAESISFWMTCPQAPTKKQVSK